MDYGLMKEHSRKFSIVDIKEHRVEFVRRAGIRARETNNIVERLHGTLKDRLKVMRGLKSEETAEIILSGWFVFYNFIRPHESLKGKTPAEAVGT